jgi:phage terminase large subunit
MRFRPNKLFFSMATAFKQRVTPKEKLIIINEGSSRSSKTWDTFHLIVAICDHNRGKNLDIYILRQSLVACRDFTLKEFISCLKKINIFHQSRLVENPKPVYDLFGHKIKFRGLDDESSAEGNPSDILFFNEVLDMKKSECVGLIMRCRRLVVMDYNPKVTEHWVYDMVQRPDVLFTKTTYKDNKHLQASVRKEIESYDPSNPANVLAGTADDYRWRVYGLGERCQREGAIFQNYEIGEFNEDLFYSFGMDFGWSPDPTVLVKVAIDEREKKIFIKELFYSTLLGQEKIIDLLNNHVKKNDLIVADSSDQRMIDSIRDKGFNIFPAEKGPGSVREGISYMQDYKLVITESSVNIKKELMNYIWSDKKAGIPIDKFNHCIDAVRYALEKLRVPSFFFG